MVTRPFGNPLIPGPIPTFRLAWFTADYVRYSPIADIGTHPRDVRFVPKQTSADSFDHLVGEQLHRSGHLQGKRFGSFDVDY